MEWSWIIFLALAGVAWWQRPDMRRDMTWAAMLALPVVMFMAIPGRPHNPGDGLLLFNRFATGLGLAAFASVVYKLVFRRYLSPSTRPDRHTLSWLGLGPIVFFVFAFVFKWEWPMAMLLALVTDTALVLIIRPGLLWDMIVSGLGIGLLYLAIALLLTALPGGFSPRIFPGPGWSVSIFGLALDELLLVTLFGALWGPLYVALKHYTETTPPKPHFIRPKIIVSSIVQVVVLGVLAWGANMTMAAPNIETISPAKSAAGVSLVHSIQITFNRPVSRDQLKLDIQPAVDGQWEFSDSLLGTHAFRTAVFRPDTVFTPSTTYRIHIAETKSLLGVGDGRWDYSFTTRALPTVASVTPDLLHSIASCTTFTVKLTDANPHLADYTFVFEPNIEFTPKLNDDLKSYTLTPSGCLTQGGTYALRVRRQPTAYDRELDQVTSRGANEEIYGQVFTTVPAPNVTGITPSGDQVSKKTKTLSIDFSRDIGEAASSAFVLNPALPGEWKWTSPTHADYSFKEDLPKDTTISVKIPAGTRDGVGGFFETEVTHDFHTLGPVKIVAVDPVAKETGVSANAAIHIRFNQPVDHASAESRLSLTPAVKGVYSWNGTTMNFQPSEALKKDSNYIFTMATGVQGAEGDTLDVPYSSGFATEISRKILSIAQDYQDQALSCEAAALKMALAGKGVFVSESQIMSIVGYDPTTRHSGIWGDPYTAFVGSITGHQNTTGYGVYWDPIARAAKHWRRDSAAFQGWTIQQLAQSIADGHPVVIWGTLGSAYQDSWKTPSGRTISAWKGEHARTVIGVVGSVANPLQFIVNDPIVGRVTWSVATLKGNWGRFNNSGVVVR